MTSRPLNEYFANAYPAKSIRQIPGAFERLTHRVAGRTLTLDQIEQTVLSGFGDPRVYLALGRGTEGGGRLRSEVFTDEKLEAQLTQEKQFNRKVEINARLRSVKAEVEALTDAKAS